MTQIPARSSCQIPATTSPEMDPGIWSRLPEELLERILALLPMKTFLNLRTTCKHFKFLLFSPSFLSQTKTPPLSSFILLSHPQFHNLFPLHDAFFNRWRMLSLSPTLPPKCASLRLVSASNGRLCFSLPNSFLICNLLTKSTKTIEFPRYPFTSTTLISASPSSPRSSPSLHGYKIFSLCYSPLEYWAFVYDSRTEKWTRSESFDPILSQNSHQDAVFFNGSLHFTTREPFSIVGFELDTGRWWKSTVELPQELVFVRLVSDSNANNGNLYLVGGTGRDGISENLKVWELREGETKVAEIASLPELMWRKFGSVCYHNYEHVYCLWHDGMVCVCCYTWPEILVYKVGRKTWHSLSKCPFLPEKWSCGFRWFSFSPDFYASV
ncbi:F-box/kelch-repeat protein At5g43190-like [Magnolia sinica]|uniref:F-box/kelch-repeat protein At5g43190-like n=1 Tax=Magnolia sinica TaxID=86752 RepID=UPI00265B1880|nr:F-box/kelch-repeat protein At5g43190-like [Magnolia sinica]